MINGCIAIPGKDPKTWRSRGRKKRSVIACPAVVTPPPLKKRPRGPIIRLHEQAGDRSREQPPRSIIVEPKRKPNSILAHLLEEITPEEQRRRGELADELFRTVVRRAKAAAEKPAPPARSYSAAAAPEASGRAPDMGHIPPASWLRHHDRSMVAMANLDIIIPGPEMESDPEATALWEQTGSFIGAALARMERGKAFSIMLGRLQHELRDAYGAENARKVLQAIMETLEAG